MPGRLVAGLAHARVEPEVADEPARAREALDLADRGDERERDRAVDAGDRQQPLHGGRGEADLGQLAVDESELLTGDVEPPQRRGDGDLLIDGQWLPGQPSTALLAEQVGGRAARQQVAMQDRLHLVLQPRALAHDASTASDQPPQRLQLLVRPPDAGQVTGRQELRQDAGIDLVRLHLGLGDRPRAQRVRDHDPRDVLLEQPRDRKRVPGRLDRDLVRLGEALREQAQRLRRRRNLPARARNAALQDRHLAELAMDIQTDRPHRPVTAFPVRVADSGGRWAPRHLRIRARSASGQVAGAAIY